MSEADSSPGSEALLRVAEGLDVVRIDDNEVLVQFGTRSTPSELLRDTDLSGVLGPLISRLATGPIRLSDLVSEVPAEHRGAARDLIDRLLKRGIVSDVCASPVDQYLTYTLEGSTGLTARRVSLLGAGPIGARIALNLLQSGLGHVTLVDHRPVDRLWLSLVPPASTESRAKGQPAHQVLRDRLLEAGFTGVDSAQSLSQSSDVEVAVASSHLTILALEQPDLRLAHLVNRLCVRDHRPWLLTGIDGNFGSTGPLFDPPDTACYNDFRVLADAANPNPEMVRTYRRYLLQRSSSSFFPGLPAYAELVAAYASLAAVHFLLRDTCFALGRVLTIDFDRLQIEVEDVLRLPRCPVCGSDKSAYHPPFSAEVVTRSESMARRDGPLQAPH